jgi:putative phosphoesterase
MLVAVIADTHMPRGSRRLPPRGLELISEADALVHAGDFVTAQVLHDLKALGPPVHAVHGNVDEPELRRVLPADLELDLAGWRIAVVHDSGPKRGRVERLRRHYPDADAVIFGHSHMPEHQATSSGFQIFNPGSPTERRRAPWRSMGLMRVEERVDFELVDLS